MSMSSSPAGWHHDPTGGHELRYWDGNRWTEHVSDNGVQSTAPLVAVAATDQRRRRGKAAWIVGAIATLAVVAVVIGVLDGSSGDDAADGVGSGGSGGADVDSAQSFCDDFGGTWSIVTAGMISAETLMYQASTDPNFSGGGTDAVNSVTQAAQDASVIAGEAPADLQDQIASMSDFLGLGVQLAGGDASVADDMTSLGVSSEDAAYLLGSVPVSKCPAG
jgi:hypothetical protein